MKLLINNYAITPNKFIAGTRGSYGIEPIELEFSEEWDGLSVTVSFYPASGDPVSLLYTGQHFYIPAEVMNVSGTCKYVVSGYRDEKRLISAEGILRVINTSTPTDNPAIEPTPDLFSQIMTAIGNVSDIAESRPKSYAPMTGNCPGLTVGEANSLTGESVASRETLLSESPVAGGSAPVALYAGKLHTADGMTVYQQLENGNFVDSSEWTTTGASLDCENYTAAVTLDAAAGRNAGRTVSANLSLSAGTPYTYPESDILTRYEVTSSTPTVATVSPNGNSLVITPLSKGMTTLHFVPLEGVYTAPEFTLLVSVNGATPAQTSTPFPGIYSAALPIKAMTPYFFTAQIKAPKGMALNVKLGTLRSVATAVQTTGEWQNFSATMSVASEQTAPLAIYDGRKVTASCTVTGGYYSYARMTDPARLLAVASPREAGTTVLTFTRGESGWTLAYPGGQTLEISPEMCGLTLLTAANPTGSLVGSVVKASVVNPFSVDAEASVLVSSNSGMAMVSVDACAFAGGIEGVESGTYTLRYVSGAWRFQGRPVLPGIMGITYTPDGDPQEGATIKVTLTVTPEKFYLRNVQLGRLDTVGLSDKTNDALTLIYGSSYHHPGISHASVAGIRCLDTDGEVVDGGMYFDEPITLRRMPDGTADTLDLESGKLIRRVGVQIVTGQTGDFFTLKGAASKSAVLSEYEVQGESIGAVSGGVLRLSRALNGTEVFYILSTPQESDISLSDTFRVCPGGTEQLVTREDDNYVPAPVGVPVKLSYSLDVWHQCRSDSDKITALLVALGLATSSDSTITALAAQISAAISALQA